MGEKGESDNRRVKFDGTDPEKFEKWEVRVTSYQRKKLNNGMK